MEPERNSAETQVLSTNRQTYNDTTPSHRVVDLDGENINFSVKKHPGGLVIVSGKNNIVSVENIQDCTVRCQNSCTIKFQAKGTAIPYDDYMSQYKEKSQNVDPDLTQDMLKNIIVEENEVYSTEKRRVKAKNQNQDAESINENYNIAFDETNSDQNDGSHVQDDEEAPSTINAEWKDKIKTEEEKCCVCLEYIYCDPENKPFWTLKCGHQYHIRCLKNCFDQDEYRNEDKKCFMCRKPIRMEELDAMNYIYM